ncbi:type VII secretion-associated protein [Tsukamurella sp. 8F]|uniref:type VII secretion-associated protein n=1 Tax=unclassified Tsukamurella TaxID=2633480 RepID=UPI0023B88D95|nr:MULTISPECIES: type VII secretion-associated protein [unclassified Tsukamurella]MDF0530895.1 type VII secretion-associated protein [Tsukamurella sp. 8J]MDF0588160.1 type VII secretion-associated protein [Tsukamurella sp. 8F]
MDGVGDRSGGGAAWAAVDCADDHWTISTGCSGARPDGDGCVRVGPEGPTSMAPPADIVAGWRAALAGALGPRPVRAVLAVPSLFGGPRRSLVAAAATACGYDPVVVPRAEAIVRSQGLLYCRRALVLETVADGAVGHVLDFADDDWAAVRGGTGTDLVELARGLIDEGVDQVLVDADETAYRRVRDALAAAEPRQWRVVRIDREALVAALVPQPEPEEPQSADVPRRRRSGPALAAAALLCLVVVSSAAVLAVRGPGSPAVGAAGAAPSSSGRPATTVDVALDGVTVALPAGWAVAEAEGRRVARADDGRRVSVVHHRLARPATRDAVAADLLAALPGRVDARIVGLEPRTNYAGRDVVGYREQLAPDRFVLWYVVVDGTHQVSVGCEPGRGAESVEPHCMRAVGSVRAG